MNYDFTNCTLCPRKCGANRCAEAREVKSKRAFCGQTSCLKVARASLHMWEEPPISGENGSGTVFFCGCSLKCIYCQNNAISHGELGEEVSISRLAKIFCYLQDKGAHNINLVTPTHFTPQIADAIDIARGNGLTLPIISNTSGYESRESLSFFKEKIDIYLTDFKYASNELAIKYSSAPNYPKVASVALDEMFSQVGEYKEDLKTGLLKKGIVVRHLMLPGSLEDSKAVMRLLANKPYSDKICVSLMNQYTPFKRASEKFPELGQKVKEDDYNKLIDYALSLGLTNSFYQVGDTAKESFIPNFEEGLPA